jgi:hypothetical protein
MRLDNRLPIEHGVWDYARRLPSYYVGRCVIGDGPTDTWAFIWDQFEQSVLNRFFRSTAYLLKAVHSVRNVTVEPGDSPGSYPYLLVVAPDGSWTYRVTAGESDRVRFVVGLYDSEGWPMGDQIQVVCGRDGDLAERLVQILVHDLPRRLS